MHQDVDRSGWCRAAQSRKLDGLLSRMTRLGGEPSGANLRGAALLADRLP
jgi:hypothetical protein